MKRRLAGVLVTLILGLAAGACGDSERTVCDEAVDKLESCGSSGQEVDDCSGIDECVAECVVSASCEDLTLPTSRHMACLAACSGS